jgi:lipopolysaccharide export system protein LptA
MTRIAWVGVLAIAGAAGLVCGQGAAPAANSTVIQAKHLDFDYPSRTAVFEGDVVVTDPRVKISADTITAVFTTNNQPESVTAVGNVRIEQTDRIAYCQRAVYSVGSGLMVLTGKPRIERGGDTIEGSRIVFNRDSDKIACEDAVLKIMPGRGKGGVDKMFR